MIVAVVLAIAAVGVLGLLVDWLFARLDRRAHQNALRALVHPAGVDLHLATIEQITVELNRRPEFVGVLVVPKGTYHVGRDQVRVGKVLVSMAGCDVVQSIQALRVATETLVQLRESQRRKGDR